MRNCMIDIETLGTRPGSIILSIGAIWFGPAGLGDSFYEVINRVSSIGADLTEDEATRDWWDRQEETAREILYQSDDPKLSKSLGTVLIEFSTWIADNHPNPLIWGNGASFDNVLLSTVYRKTGHKLPWGFFNDRCYRTLKNFRPEIKLVRSGSHHNALDDATTQATHAIEILNDLKVWEE